MCVYIYSSFLGFIDLLIAFGSVFILCYQYAHYGENKSD